MKSLTVYAPFVRGSVGHGFFLPLDRTLEKPKDIWRQTSCMSILSITNQGIACGALNKPKTRMNVYSANGNQCATLTSISMACQDMQGASWPNNFLYRVGMNT